MGKDAPVEWLIATITAFYTVTMFPIINPMFSRASRRGQRTTLFAIALGLIAVILLFISPFWSPYDDMHPKRMGVQYTYNATDGKHTAHLAFMDKRDNARYAREFHEQYGQGSELIPTIVDDYNSDWDTLYPVSTFLETYKFPLENVDFDWPKVTYTSTRTLQADGNTHIQLRIDHPHLVWPAFAFEAEIITWGFGVAPPDGKRRHHIKSATSVNEHVLDFDLVVKLEPDQKLQVHYSGVDKHQMVPGTASRLGPDMPASRWLMDMDQWAFDKYASGVDMCMSGIIAGVIEV
jgi:hypothetical protein